MILVSHLDKNIQLPPQNLQVLRYVWRLYRPGIFVQRLLFYYYRLTVTVVVVSDLG